MKQRITCLLFLSVFLFTLPLHLCFASPEEGPFPGDKAIDFTLKTLDGTSVNLSKLRHGKNVLIFFWASWCKDSKSSLPEIQEAFKTFDHSKLEIVGINTDVRDSIAHAKNFQKENDVKFTLLYDSGSEVSNKYMVMGTPRFFLVNKDGIIVHSSGEFPKNLKKIVNSH